MLTAIENNLIERQLALYHQQTPICLNAFRDVLSQVVEVYKESSFHCNFQELIAASLLFLEVCASQVTDLSLSKEMILNAASDIEKACRRCLNRILFETGAHDLETEAEEIGVRLSVFKIMNMIRELGLSKEELLLEKSQSEIEHTLQSLKSQLTTAFNPIIENSITALRFIDKREPEASLLVSLQGYVGYLIGVVSRITKKEAKGFYLLDH